MIKELTKKQWPRTYPNDGIILGATSFACAKDHPELYTGNHCLKCDKIWTDDDEKCTLTDADIEAKKLKDLLLVLEYEELKPKP